MSDDRIEVEILPDGTIKISTDKISQANHTGADKLLAILAELAGGKVTVLKQGHHAHTHTHTHEHH